MGCAKSKPEVAPEELPVLDADEEERKQLEALGYVAGEGEE